MVTELEWLMLGLEIKYVPLETPIGFLDFFVLNLFLTNNKTITTIKNNINKK